MAKKKKKIIPEYLQKLIREATYLSGSYCYKKKVVFCFIIHLQPVNWIKPRNRNKNKFVTFSCLFPMFKISLNFGSVFFKSNDKYISHRPIDWHQVPFCLHLISHSSLVITPQLLAYLRAAWKPLAGTGGSISNAVVFAVLPLWGGKIVDG